MRTKVPAAVGLVLFSVIRAPQRMAQVHEAVAYFRSQQDPVPAAESSPEQGLANISTDQGHPEELTIANGDLLGVSLFDTDFGCNADKSGCDARVNSSGAIVLPLIGSVRVAVLSVAQAGALI